MRLGSVAAALLGVAFLLPAPAASATPNHQLQLRLRATALRVEVDRLTIAAEAATEDYDTVVASLDALAGRRVLAEQHRDDLADVAAARRAEVDRHVRALYQRGGDLGLLTALLTADTPATLLTSAQAAEAASSSDAAVMRNADALVAEATRTAQSSAALDDRQRRLEAERAAHTTSVEGLLRRAAALLQGADADVRQLADAQRRVVEQRAARAFATRLAAARRLSPPASGSGATSVPPPAPLSVAGAIAAARSKLGAPYVWGDEGPDTFDCSGLTSWAYAQAGVHLPRTSRQQWWAGRRVETADLLPGDLLFWASNLTDPRTIHHVAIYLGSGQMIVAPHTGAVVRIEPVYATGYLGAVRPTS